MVARSQLGVYQKVAVTARYRISSNNDTDITDLKSRLYAALAAVVSRHPILSATVVNSESFARLPYIDLDQVVTFSQIKTLDDIDGKFTALDRFLENEHIRPWDLSAALPLWRIHVLQKHGDNSGFLLSYYFHHASGDTKSALVFHEGLEEALNDARPEIESGSVSSKSVSKIPTPTDLSVLPPLDDFPQHSASAGTGHSGAQESKSPSGVWTGGVQSLPVQTRVRSLWLSAEQSARLARRCKKNGVSITAALQPMLAAALFTHIPEEYTTLKTSIPVSLRGWLPSPIAADSMGVFIDTFPETYHRQPFSWDEAKRTKRTIDKVVQNRRVGDLVEKLSHISDVKAEVDEKLGRPRSDSMELSNVGKLAPLQSGKEYQIESLLFSQSAGALSPAIKISVVTGRDGRLTFGFSWQEGVVDDGLMEKVIEEFEETLGM